MEQIAAYFSQISHEKPTFLSWNWTEHENRNGRHGERYTTRERCNRNIVILRKSENVNPRRLDTILLWSLEKQTNKEIPFYLAPNSIPDSASKIANGYGESFLSDSPLLLRVARVPYNSGREPHAPWTTQSSASPTIYLVGGATVPHHALLSPTTPPSLSPPGDQPTVRPWSPTQTHRRSREGRRDGSCPSRVPFFPVSSAYCPLAPGIHAFPPSHWLDLSPGSLVTHAHSRSFSRKRWPGSTPALGASSVKILREIARISTVFRPTSFDRAGNYWFSRENRG